ncbi:Protein EXORDIUM-like 3 [Orobanche minor]
MAPPPSLTAAITLAPLLLLLFFAGPVVSWRPLLNTNQTGFLYNGSKKYEGSSDFVDMKYHMGPVLSADITIHIIWYGGKWQNSQKRIIREFIGSISAANSTSPSVAGWWKTVRLYTDQTGSNVSQTVRIGAEKNDRLCSHGKSLSRLSVQSVIKSAVTARTEPLPISPSGIYLLLTSDEVSMENFCSSACGFHYFTFPSIVGYTLPYAWVGNSAKLCPGMCAYPFAVPNYIPGLKAVVSPNRDVGVDGMISVIAHEIAEVSTNPLVNAWYAGEEPTAPVEIADLCEGIYGTGGGGSYTGQMLSDRQGATYNMKGIRRKFLVQWVWNNVLQYCTGPNALDQ